MNICIYVYMYICIYVYMYICMCKTCGSLGSSLLLKQQGISSKCCQLKDSTVHRWLSLESKTSMETLSILELHQRLTGWWFPTILKNLSQLRSSSHLLGWQMCFLWNCQASVVLLRQTFQRIVFNSAHSPSLQNFHHQGAFPQQLPEHVQSPVCTSILLFTGLIEAICRKPGSVHVGPALIGSIVGIHHLAQRQMSAAGRYENYSPS